MNASRNSEPETGGIGGRHVLAAMLAFFGVIIIADATMIYKAVSTFGGLESANAYRDGLAYNARIARDARQSASGWHDAVEVLPNPARVRVSFKGADGQPIENLRIEAVLGRPATNRSDMLLRPQELTPGVFEAPIGDSPAPGTWIATIKAFQAGGAADEPVYQTRRRLWIAP